MRIRGALHLLLHGHGGLDRIGRIGKGAEDFIADGLDGFPAVAARDAAEQGQALLDLAQRGLVAQGFIQARAAADVGEQDGKRQGRRIHGKTL
jgi:hypothetical protein